MTLLKILNPIVCIPSEYNLDEIQDMGFKEQLKACSGGQGIQRGFK